MSNSDIEYPVVVGIDFGWFFFLQSCIHVAFLTRLRFILGTTYTGCAYAFIQNEEVVDIVRW